MKYCIDIIITYKIPIQNRQKKYGKERWLYKCIGNTEDCA